MHEFRFLRKIAFLFFDGNKKWALICKHRQKETAPAHMCWDKMVKLGKLGALKISRLQRAAQWVWFSPSPCLLHGAGIGWPGSQEPLWGIVAGALFVASMTGAICTDRWSSIPPVGPCAPSGWVWGKRSRPLAWDQSWSHRSTEADGWLELSGCSGGLFILVKQKVIFLPRASLQKVKG